jgi:hypothetical protein
MDDRPRPSFMAYWDKIDAAMKKLFGIDTTDAGIGAGTISNAYDRAWDPEAFALSFGKRYGLRLLTDRSGA